MSVVSSPDEQAGEIMEPRTRVRSLGGGASIRALVEWLASPLNLFLGLLTLVPIVYITLYIIVNGVNVPYIDQWGQSAVLAIKIADGTFTVSDLFRQLNEHRFLMTNLTTYVMTVLTHWNIRAEMMVILVLALVNFGLFVTFFRRQERAAVGLVLVPFAVLLFAPRQRMNWLLSLQTSWHYVILFFLLALLLVSARPIGWRTLILAGICCALSFFSTAHGILTWPLLLIFLLLRGYRKPAYFAAWIGMALVSILLYFSNYDFSIMGANTEGQSAGLFTNPFAIVRYAVAYLGNAFVPESGLYWQLSSVIALAGGALMLINALFLWWQKQEGTRVTLWLILAAFSAGVGLMTGMGRGSVFPDPIPVQPLLERYVTPALPFWIAFFSLIALAIVRIRHDDDQSSAAVWLVRVNIIAVVCLIPLFLFANLRTVSSGRLVNAEMEQCVLDYPRARNGDCLDFIYTKGMRAIDIQMRTDQLAAYRLAAFAEMPPIYDQVIQLVAQPHFSVGDVTQNGFRFYQFNDTFRAIVFNEFAPAQEEFQITVPQTDHSVVLVTAAYVEREGLTEFSPPSTVLFRIGVRDEDGSAARLGELNIDPTQQVRPQAIRLDLGAYKGRSIQLIFQTRIDDSAFYNEAMWVDPIVVVLPE